jgi:hypothetical protein
MPIQLTAIAHDKLLHGCTWAVPDEQFLSELIAYVALGQARHVRKILLATGSILPMPDDYAKSSATKMLTVAPNTDSWHRDGWMFQVMSWLAASKSSPDSIITTPQMRLADKGFDGLQLDFDSGTGALSAVVIFEDKATDNPRGTIQSKVWPDFEQMEKGDRANVLVAEVTSLLEKRAGIDVDDVIKKVIWKDVRRFRVSITVQDTHATHAGRENLFKGYDATVEGGIERRRGETFYVSDLRPWMSNIANKAIRHIAIGAPTNV